ncbi:MAG: YchF/TatD family DNA exonuclease [Alphaproteobacteria bacterium]|nr:YchF/TatD family DNA exonuclease [Alphaproteobacteria bacterium]
MWIDSHCHLNHPKLQEAGALAEIIQKAEAHQVDAMLTISCRPTEELPVLEKLIEQPNIWMSLGTHPHDSGKHAEKELSADWFINKANENSKIIAIGETGLDYHYDFSPRDDQFVAFRKQLAVARATKLPVIIHAREADEDIIKVLKEEGAGTTVTGVMHSFSSSAWMAQEALDFGFYISFSGMVTFKNADELRAIAKTVPLDRILVETDAPYLAPEPMRGKTNEPAFVSHTGKFLADHLGIEEKEFARITTENFFKLFPKAQDTWQQS